MITVSFKRDRKSETEVIVVKRVTWLDITRHFICYDIDEEIVLSIDPYYFEVKAIVDAPVDIKEVSNVERNS